jgi:hypothetical protein
VLLRDLPSLYGISDVQELNRLFTSITHTPAALYCYWVGKNTVAARTGRKS